MRVLMLGWEFPPFISGGLGTACFGLTKGLSEAGVEVLFALPRPPGSDVESHVHFLGRGVRRQARAKPVEFRHIPSDLKPYARPAPTPREGLVAAPSEAPAVAPVTG